MGRKSTGQQIRLSDGNRERLERIIRSPKRLQKHVWRSSIILELGSRRGIVETMRRTGMSKPMVWHCWGWFLNQGVNGLFPDATRPPSRNPISEDRMRSLIDPAMPLSPTHARHSTLRDPAGTIDGMAVTTVHSILRRHEIRPHRFRTFRISPDPGIELKVRDVVGLYVNLPDHAVVLLRGKNTRIQMLGRTRQPLPMTPEHVETRTHDHRHSGGTSLMEILDAETVKVTGQAAERHRSGDLPAFISHVAKEIRPETPVHMILGNVSPHRSADAHEWLKAHADWTFHFTPASSPLVNVVEGFLSRLAGLRLKNAVSDSLGVCISAVENYSEHRNASSTHAFRWDRTTEDTVKSV